MVLVIKNINKYIDYIQDPNDTFEEYLKKAKEYNVRCVFADPDEIDTARQVLEGTDIIIAGAVDFPQGKLSLKDKLADFKKIADLGIKEIDYVLNQAQIESRDYNNILTEMKEIADFSRTYGVADKAIVEMCKLDQEAKKSICEIALKAKPAFLKTSTGRSFGGATVEDVRLMKSILKDEVKIKAAGGIKNYDFACELIKAGANVLGASAAVNIIEGEKWASS